MKFGVIFLEHAFEGHIQQKNWAKEQAKNHWVLSLDADEALDETLRNSIKNVKISDDVDAFKMNRLTNYCGKWIKHTSWYPDTKLRLFDKKQGHWGGTNPHDEFLMDKNSRIVHLKGDILHYSFYTTEEHLKQITKFSTIGAKSLFDQNKKANLVKVLVNPTARFIKNYILRLGFLDGKAGFAISKYSAYANYLKYSKLRKLYKGQSIE